MTHTKKIISLILALLIIASAFSLSPMHAKADSQYIFNILVRIDNREAETVRALSVTYDNNNYISLKDMAVLLSDTDRAFSLAIDKSSIAIATADTDISSLETAPAFDKAFDISERNISGWTSEEISSYTANSLGMTPITINDSERKYYTILISESDGYDCFINLADFCLLLDIDADLDEDGNIEINSQNSMPPVNPALLEGYGYFQGVNSVLVGDATTNEIFYSYNDDREYPIASTTKIMTCLLTLEAISRGDISKNDMITISKKAAALSKTSDGVTPMTAGNKISVEELLYATMLPSSNECALTLAEYIAGSEEDFVELMNSRAAELGMNSATYYNCNGLPIYSQTMIPAKMQNHMTSHDMFILVSYLMNTYPEVKKITTTTKTNLSAINNMEIKNTNALLYNLPETTGLKTGTTTKSGACLVSTFDAQDNGTTHDLVVILLGAESSQDRIRVSELLAHYALAVVNGDAQKVIPATGEESTSPSANPESIVNLIVNSALKSRIAQ